MNETQNGITEKPVYFDKTETWCVLGALFFCFVPLLILLGETTDYKINERRYFFDSILPFHISVLWYSAACILLTAAGMITRRVWGNKRAKHKTVKTVLAVLLIILGMTCWVTPAVKFVNYQSSEPHSCFQNSSRNIDWVNNECVKRINVDVVDQVIEYTDTKHVTKKNGNKYVEGTEFTVNKTDKTYGTGYKTGDVFFLPDEGSSGYVWADTPGVPALSVMNDVNHALGNKNHNKKYVVHTTQKEVIEPITGGASNWAEGVTKEFDGKTFFHKSYPSEYYVHEGEQHVNPVFMPTELVEK